MSSETEPQDSVGRVRLNRAAIVDEAKEIVSSSGLDQLSLRKLADRLGVTAPALYAHVKDKDDILRAIADLGFHDLTIAYGDVETTDLCERLKALSRAYVDLAVAQPEVFQLMFLYRPREIDLPELDNVLQSATDAFEVPLATVTEAIDAGELHRDRDPLITALVLWTTAHGVATVRLLGMGFDSSTADELTDVVIDATIDGLRQPPH